MALLDLYSVFYNNLKFSLAVLALAAYKNTGAISGLAVLLRHFISTNRTLDFYFFNAATPPKYSRPALAHLQFCRTSPAQPAESVEHIDAASSDKTFSALLLAGLGRRPGIP